MNHPQFKALNATNVCVRHAHNCCQRLFALALISFLFFNFLVLFVMVLVFRTLSDISDNPQIAYVCRRTGLRVFFDDPLLTKSCWCSRYQSGATPCNCAIYWKTTAATPERREVFMECSMPSGRAAVAAASNGRLLKRLESYVVWHLDLSRILPAHSLPWWSASVSRVILSRERAEFGVHRSDTIALGCMVASEQVAQVMSYASRVFPGRFSWVWVGKPAVAHKVDGHAADSRRCLFYIHKQWRVVLVTPPRE